MTWKEIKWFIKFQLLVRSIKPQGLIKREVNFQLMIIIIGTVNIEKRGIYTKPAKEGASGIPGILFSEYKEDRELLKLKKTLADEAKLPKKRSKSNDGKNFKEPFKPAALSKNEPFQSDGRLYGEDEKDFKSLLDRSLEVA